MWTYRSLQLAPRPIISKTQQNDQLDSSSPRDWIDSIHPTRVQEYHYVHTAHASGSHGPDTPIHIHRSSIWSSRPYIHTYIVDGRRTATRTVGRRFLQRQHATFFNRPRTSREELNKFLFFLIC